MGFSLRRTVKISVASPSSWQTDTVDCMTIVRMAMSLQTVVLDFAVRYLGE